jgi:4-oxalocrotonate tautomerase
MPVVHVFWWAGRDALTKEKAIKGITKAFEDIGVSASAVTVIIHDIPKENWGSGGEQASKKFP